MSISHRFPQNPACPNRPSAPLSNFLRSLITAPPKSLRRTPVSAICHACKLDFSFLPRRSHAKAGQLAYPYRFYRIIELDDATQVTNPPVITTQPLSSQTVPMGGSVILSVTALGAPPLKYQWFKDGASMAGVTSASLVMVNATRRHSGVYVAVVSNPVGQTLSSNATVVVRVPEKLGWPTRLADGTFALTAGDADGGLLLPGDLPSFEAQVSTNLVNWMTLSNGLTLTNGLLLLRDPASTNSPSRFYRIIEP